MATPLTRDTKRDKDLIADYKKADKNGKWVYATYEIVVKYKISSTRIYQILNHYGISKRKPNTTSKMS